MNDPKQVEQAILEMRTVLDNVQAILVTKTRAVLEGCISYELEDTIADLHKAYYDSLIEGGFIRPNQGVVFDNHGSIRKTNEWSGTSWHQSQLADEVITGEIDDVRTISHLD